MRKDVLKINQTDFAKKILLTQNFFTRVENNQRNLSDRSILDICREYNVNEEWLRNGDGEIFIEQSTENLDLIAEEYKLSDLSKSVMSKFLAMDGENRDTILNFVKELFVDEESNLENTSNVKMTTSVPNNEYGNEKTTYTVFKAARSSNDEKMQNIELSKDEYFDLLNELENAPAVTREEDL